ncbi:MAG: alpha-galactosidase [Eubacteriales bacterium]|jgi:alpha-galactosidase
MSRTREGISGHSHISGTWAREHRISTQEIGYGGVSAEALRGECGHSSQPFIAILSEGCGEDSGEVYAMHFVYSGNFLAKVQKDPFDQIRMVMGIHPETFEWKLEPGAAFDTPEAVLVYSDTGLGGMTRVLHDFYRKHLIRSPWQFRERPILINNWEATYFDFDSDKLVSIADAASRLGINMLVCDDGWFGAHRDQPSSGLGDWTVNEKKIHPVYETVPENGTACGLSDEKRPEKTDGMRSLIGALKARGMKFGLWFEPEMISKDSDLFRKHSDWVLHLKGREPGLCRDQWVLDYSNPAVTDFIFESIAALLRKYDIAYLKWDMNRPLTDAGSEYLPADRQGEIWHRHVLGLYSIQERLINEFPELLIENCSSGGARFDPGMLYYSPQIWCSDDMDPIERLSIEEGTELLYPLSTMGAHVCKSPNDISKRVVPFATRALMAMTGTFGYELDITKIPEKERNEIPAQVRLYKEIRPLIQQGDLYRIASFRTNHEWDAICVISKNKAEGFLMYVQGLYVPNAKSRRICLKGLDPDRRYSLTEISSERPDLTEKKLGAFGGDTLMHAGILLKRPDMDFGAVMVRILAEDAGK